MKLYKRHIRRPQSRNRERSSHDVPNREPFVAIVRIIRYLGTPGSDFKIVRIREYGDILKLPDPIWNGCEYSGHYSFDCLSHVMNKSGVRKLCLNVPTPQSRISFGNGNIILILYTIGTNDGFVYLCRFLHFRIAWRQFCGLPVSHPVD